MTVPVRPRLDGNRWMLEEAKFEGFVELLDFARRHAVSLDQNTAAFVGRDLGRLLAAFSEMGDNGDPLWPREKVREVTRALSDTTDSAWEGAAADVGRLLMDWSGATEDLLEDFARFAGAFGLPSVRDYLRQVRSGEWPPPAEKKEGGDGDSRDR